MAKVTDEYPVKGQELTNEQLKAKATAEALAAQPVKNQTKEFKQAKFPSAITPFIPSKTYITSCITYKSTRTAPVPVIPVAELICECNTNGRPCEARFLPA